MPGVRVGFVQFTVVVPLASVAVTLVGDAGPWATAAAGQPGVLGGLDSWYDAATFTRFGGTPSIGYGPRSIEWAHTVDEYVPVDDLVACAGALAIAAAEHCGVAE